MGSDSVPHNVHTLSEKNKAFNKAVNKGGELEMAYDEEEVFFVKCDIHPWMKSYVSVVSHPFFHVTEKDGKYQQQKRKKKKKKKKKKKNFMKKKKKKKKKKK